jgi:antirestriction protein
MAEPITTAIIVGLTAQKSAEKLWDTIAIRFSGRKKTEENLAAIVAAKGQDVGAIEKVTAVLAGEFVEDEDFAASLKDLAQQIVNIQSQSQTQSTNTFTSNDTSQMRAVGQVYGTANLGDQK